MLPGFVTNPYQWLAHASLFVLSSAWEGLPTVLVEALACGVPVVATDCPHGPREILKDGEVGPLVPCGDHVALAAAMRVVLMAPPPRRVLVQRAAEFSIAKAVDRYENLLGRSY
jgi:glycosyltransferase involved in cell wall biosynthesis